MPIHPEIAKILADLPAPPAGPIDPLVLRAGEAGQVPPPQARLPVSVVADATLETAGGSVPVRIYVPDDEPTRGVLVYFHGGAFFLGSLDTHDHVARALANQTGWTVVSVGYRLAPEHPYPSGLRDCYDVVRWVAEHAQRGRYELAATEDLRAVEGSAGEPDREDPAAWLGWDGRRLAIAGDSSGGTFVAAVAALARDDGFDAITHQVLYYPSLDLDFDVDRYPSLTENATGYGLETAGLKPFNAFYIESGADPADPFVSPIKQESLAGQPPALIVTAEFDPLRDEGELYARRLREAGVPVQLSRYEGANHGFVQNFSWLPEFGRVYEETALFLDGTAAPGNSGG